MGNSLEGKVAMVTASTRGIGYAIANRFADEGAKVYFAVRNQERGAEAVKAVRARGLRADLVPFNGDDPATHTAAVETIVAKEGRLDILVNNFGQSDPKKDLDITRITYETFEETVTSDLSSVFNTCKAAANLAMIPQNSGSIINIGSVAGICPDNTQCGYGVAKASILHLTRMMAKQLAPYFIRVNAINPGIIATDAVADNLTAELQEMYLQNTLIKRLGTPGDIAAMALFLAGDESTYITSHFMNVSGGWGC